MLRFTAPFVAQGGETQRTQRNKKRRTRGLRDISDSAAYN